MSDPRPGLVVRERHITKHADGTEEEWWRVLAVVPRDAPVAIAHSNDKTCAIGLAGLGRVLIVDKSVMEVHEHLSGGLPEMDVGWASFEGDHEW